MSSYTSRASHEVQGFITNSNIELLLKYVGLLGFPVFESPLFYILISFSILMLAISIWSILKDKALDRDLIKLPQKYPSKLYKLMTYIIVSSSFFCSTHIRQSTHNFICIIVLYDKKRPRAMRAVLFYTRILGVMTFSCIFNQSFQVIFLQIKKSFSTIIIIEYFLQKSCSFSHHSCCYLSYQLYYWLFHL